MRSKEVLAFIIGILISIFLVSAVRADRATSSNFIIDSGVINSGGENATSASFLMPQAFGEPALGLSTSSFFRLIGGFLGFPFVSEPVLSAAPGQEQVVLTWTASEGFLGFNVSGYDVGAGVVSEGQSFENVGNVLTFTKTGLTAGTTYFFRVRAKDEFGEVVATSNETTAVPTSAGVPPAPGGAGGAGRGVARVSVPPLFELLEEAIPKPALTPCLPNTDLNCDGRINLSDFSIFLYLMPQQVPTPADFNDDKSVDVRDLSLLFFDWTDKVLAFAGGQSQSEEKEFKQQEKPKTTENYFAVITESLGFEPLKTATTAVAETAKPSFKIVDFFKFLARLIAEIFESIAGFFH
ncbi:MAG: fibronectin type III domain-containing protein [Patescibacteria group bacterium]